MSGVLYLCATPIGNLEDMTFRVINTLKNVDLIAAEDTRNSIKLLNHFDIHVPMTSYHEYNKIDKARYLIGLLKEGKNIAVITDAGTPGISDPGEELVKMCCDEGITVSSVPGAAACITALTMSGLPSRRFCFEGFLPVDKKQQREVLLRFKTETRTTVVYEAPHRLLKTLPVIMEYTGEDRRIAVCRELTKKHETVFRGTIKEAVSYYNEHEPKGEIVIVIEGASQEKLKEQSIQAWEEISLDNHMQLYEDRGMSKKEAMKKVAEDRGLSKRDIYQALVYNKNRKTT